MWFETYRHRKAHRKWQILLARAVPEYHLSIRPELERNCGLRSRTISNWPLQSMTFLWARDARFTKYNILTEIIDYSVILKQRIAVCVPWLHGILLGFSWLNFATKDLKLIVPLWDTPFLVLKSGPDWNCGPALLLVQNGWLLCHRLSKRMTPVKWNETPNKERLMSIWMVEESSKRKVMKHILCIADSWSWKW